MHGPGHAGASAALVRHGKGSILGNPDWSPDGAPHRLLVQLADRPPDLRGGRRDAGETTRLSRVQRRAAASRASAPTAAASSTSAAATSADKSRLVEHDLGDAATEKVLVDWPALNYDPAYSPDGSELGFASNITGEYAIYRQRLADGKSWRVTHGAGDARYPDYAPAR